MNTSFWSNDPTIIFNKDYIFELWPTSSMCYEQKLNAITRLIILITILGYVLTMSNRVLLTGVATLIVIFIYFKMKKQKVTRDFIDSQEGFTVDGDNVYGLSESVKPRTIINPITLETVVRDEFKEGTKKNPFSNVLLTDIMDDPERKAAPPAFNPDIDEQITKNIKRSVQFMNPEIKNTNKQLFGSLFDRWDLDQSDRVFYSTPNTRVANDQGAFGKFLYGDMPSSKESNVSAQIARVRDSYRYTLY